MSALSAGASTQSRARRPLPPGAVSARTIETFGVTETVEFTMADGSIQRRELLSWVLGQHGCLFGSNVTRQVQFVPQVPHSIVMAAMTHDLPGSYGHAAEHRAAETLAEIYAPYIPGELGVRFGLGGSDVCAMAVRLARWHTGCKPIATAGYHGNQSDLAHRPAVHGVPDEMVDLHRRFEFGNVRQMMHAADGAACIMVEVPALDDEDAIRSFLVECRKEADYQHIPFIIDDVVLGARIALAGSLEAYGVTADMVCLGKSISATGGVSALIGRADLVGLLAEDVFFSGTFFGSPTAVNVCNATLIWLRDHPEAFEHLALVGSELKCGLNNLGIKTVGQPERSVMQFPTDTAWLEFCEAMIERGVMMHRPQYSSLAHTLADVRQTLEAAAEVCQIRVP